TSASSRSSGTTAALLLSDTPDTNVRKKSGLRLASVGNIGWQRTRYDKSYDMVLACRTSDLYVLHRRHRRNEPASQQSDGSCESSRRCAHLPRKGLTRERVVRHPDFRKI